MITAESSALGRSDPAPAHAFDLYRALFTQSPQPFALHTVTVNAAGKPLDLICIDANADTVIKLTDRGSHQAFGIVTDCAFFLKELATQLCGED